MFFFFAWIMQWSYLTRRCYVCTISDCICIGVLREVIGEVNCKALLILHSITGCDKTGRFFGIGKLTWLKLLMVSKDEELFASMENLGKQICSLTTFQYLTQKKKVSLPEERWILFTELKEGEHLPPTPSSFYQHLLRAL